MSEAHRVSEVVWCTLCVGILQARGALLASEEINAAGGFRGKPLELLTANTASKPDKAVANVAKLADQGAVMDSVGHHALHLH